MSHTSCPGTGLGVASVGAHSTASASELDERADERTAESDPEADMVVGGARSRRTVTVVDV